MIGKKTRGKKQTEGGKGGSIFERPKKKVLLVVYAAVFKPNAYDEKFARLAQAKAFQRSKRRERSD